MVAAAAGDFSDDWWIIGSAAAALAGADIAEVGDVDLLLSERDARALLARWSAAPKAPPPPSDRFRSAVFARFEHGPLAIEAFGGFEMRVRGRWRAVEPMTRRHVGDVFTPSIAEQIVLLEAMGRDKDRPRIAALAARL
ncbi:MAG: hypothetical protein A3E01_08540 [Gammaproteobacteria bacterium RIFCSPHIGHO2_12_FULL_63_22]|nr:MAG: hypothetical protein A3E01_08540 [Gammaproteobacteria bacterium RIFCSPHIGHO2_12_FULL_63_22]